MSMLRMLKGLIYTGLFLIPFIFFIVSDSLFFPFITGKAFAFRIIIEVIFAMWLILTLQDGNYKLGSSWISRTLLAFVVVVLAADIFALNPFKAFWSNYERMEGWVAILHLFAFFIVATSMFRSREIWKRFFATNVAASIMMAIYSFFQLAGEITINQGGVRVDGTFGNATYLAIYMVFNIFFAALLFFQAKNRTSKYLLVGVAVIDFVVLYFTATRGATLGMLGGALISFGYLALKAQKGEKIRKVAAASLLAILVAAGMFWALRDASFVERSPVLSRFANLSFAEIRTQGRYYVWPMAIKGFLERPILGWGQEGFSYVFNKYYDPRMYDQEPWFDRTHNIILDWLVNAGALGLLTYLLIFLALLYSIRKSGSMSKEEKAILYGLIFTYFFHNLFVFDQIGSYILFFSILAYVHSMNTYPTGWTSAFWEKVRNKFASKSLLPVSDSLVVILCAVMLYFVNFIPWRQNLSIISVLRANTDNTVASVTTYTRPISTFNMGFPEALEHVSQAATALSQRQDAPAELKQEVFAAVNQAFKTQVERTPYDVRYRFFYGIFLSQHGDFEQATAELKEAIKYSPNKQSLYIELGSELVMAGRPSEALEQFKVAYELEPSYQEAQFTYAMGAFYAGERELAEELLKGIPEKKLVNDNRYLGALLNTGQYEIMFDVLRRRIENDPTNTEHRITLASVYLQLGRRADAIREIEEIIKINPSFKEQGEYFISEIRAGRNP